MFANRVSRSAVTIAALLTAVSLPRVSAAQTSGATLDEVIPPGANFDKAEFRLWYPTDVGALQGIVVQVPGSNGDGRAEAGDSAWQAFARRHKLALVALHLNDKPHDQNFIEDYVNVSKGSGQALLDALTAFAAQSKHPEIANAPLLLWGMSAGGEFNYEFVAWKPERVMAFVVNKGGIYYTALASREARNVPGILFIGGKDLESRINTITGLFDLNRRGGALWALEEEPAAAHIVGKSKQMAMIFFEDVMALRLGAASPDGKTVLKSLTEKGGFLGDLHARTYAPQAGANPPAAPTAWFPTERVAKAWLAVETEKPIDQ